MLRRVLGVSCSNQATGDAAVRPLVCILLTFLGLGAGPEAAPRTGGPQTSGAAPSSPKTTVKTPVPDALRDGVNGIGASLPKTAPSDWQFVGDNSSRKERTAWLAKDFRAPVFLRATRVDEGVLQAETDKVPLHLGLSLFHFPRCNDLRAARAAVSKAKRQNFLLPVLTLFRSRTRGNDLLFLLSETPLHPRVATLLEKADVLWGPDSACADELSPRP